MTKTRQPADPAVRKQRLYRTLHDQIDHSLFANALRTANKLLALDPSDPLARSTHTQLLIALDRFPDALQAEQGDDVTKAYCLYKVGRPADAQEVLNQHEDVEDEEDRAREVLQAQLHYRLGEFEAARDAFDDLAATTEPDSPETADLQANLAACTSQLSFLSAVPSSLSSLPVPSLEELESRPLAFVLPSSSSSATRKPLASTPAPAEQEQKKKKRSRPLPPKALDGKSPAPPEDRWIPKRQRPSLRDELMQKKEKARGRKKEKVQLLTQGAAEVEQPVKTGGAATTRFHTARIPPDHARTPAWKDVEESLSSRLPTFPTRGREHVRVLYEPKEFYRALIDQIQRAKKRIFLASLYVGKEETELVAALHSALRKNPSLRLTFLVDYLRSTREHPNPSSASLLASLSAAFPAQVDLRLFHTPELNGWARKYIPKRFNEGWGLQHMKIYGFDDDVILSGANLSHDYFTNRADRYLHFRSHAPLADYFSSLISLVSSYSYRLTASDTSTPHPAISISWPSDSPFSPSSDPFFHDPRTSIPELKQHAHEALTAFTSSWHSRSPHSLASSLPPFPSPPSSSSSSSSLSPPPPSAALRNPRLPFLSHFDTSLRPVLQMGPFSISHETDLVVPEIFRAANALATAPGGRNTTLDWTSGYFSLREDYKKLVLDCAANVRIVSASPEANGFFGSKGVSRFIPPAYTYFAKKFWDEAQAQARKRGREESHVEMREWKREGWTYHAKGIWLAPCISNPHSPPAHDPSTSFSPSYLPDPHEQDFPLRHLAPSPPFLTLLGSSNYGSRSASRDLEATLLVTTHDKGLRWELERECRRIREFAVERVGRGTWERDERRVPWGVRWAARAIEGML